MLDAVLVSDEQSYIILHSKDCFRLLSIDRFSGELTFEENQNLFSNIQSAIDYCKKIHPKLESKTATILGYLVLGDEALILLATAIKETAKFPGCPDHTVRTITASEWISISILHPMSLFSISPEQISPPVTPADSVEAEEAPTESTEESVSVVGEEGFVCYLKEKNTAKELKLMRFDNTHYFCHTMDLTRPWPPPSEPWNQSDVLCPEFVWNSALSHPFKKLGLTIPSLMRGWCESWTTDAVKGDTSATITYLIRQSNLHPGTRFHARGLHEVSGEVGAANEYECELLVCSQDSCSDQVLDDISYNWSHYIWRRGSVPIGWSSQMSALVENVKLHEDPYLQVPGYWNKLWKRHNTRCVCCVSLLRVHHSRSQINTKKDVQSDSPSPISSANLLALEEPLMSPREPKDDSFPDDPAGNTTDDDDDLQSECDIYEKEDLENRAYLTGEAMLGVHYEESLSALTRSIGTHDTHVVHFDWHGILRRKGGQGAIQEFWDCLGSTIQQYGTSNGQCYISYGTTMRVETKSTQQGLLRFNCRDSLDRTNLGTFFSAALVLPRLLHQVGRPMAADPGSSEASYIPNVLNAMDRKFNNSLLMPLLPDTENITNSLRINRTLREVAPSSPQVAAPAVELFDFTPICPSSPATPPLQPLPFDPETVNLLQTESSPSLIDLGSPPSGKKLETKRLSYGEEKHTEKNIVNDPFDSDMKFDANNTNNMSAPSHAFSFPDLRFGDDSFKNQPNTPSSPLPRPASEPPPKHTDVSFADPNSSFLIDATSMQITESFVCSEGWEILNCKSAQDGLRLYPRTLLEQLASAFLHSGDVCASLYTGSAAMHSTLLRDFAGGQVQAAKSNFTIQLERSYHNAIADSKRQRNIETLLDRSVLSKPPRMTLEEAQRTVLVLSETNLSPEKLKSIFSSYGHIEGAHYVRIPLSDLDNIKYAGYVTFQNPTEALNAAGRGHTSCSRVVLLTSYEYPVLHATITKSLLGKANKHAIVRKAKGMMKGFVRVVKNTAKAGEAIKEGVSSILPGMLGRRLKNTEHS